MYTSSSFSTYVEKKSQPRSDVLTVKFQRQPFMPACLKEKKEGEAELHSKTEASSSLPFLKSTADSAVKLKLEKVGLMVRLEPTPSA